MSQLFIISLSMKFIEIASAALLTAMIILLGWILLSVVTNKVKIHVNEQSDKNFKEHVLSTFEMLNDSIHKLNTRIDKLFDLRDKEQNDRINHLEDRVFK